MCQLCQVPQPQQNQRGARAKPAGRGMGFTHAWSPGRLTGARGSYGTAALSSGSTPTPGCPDYPGKCQGRSLGRGDPLPRCLLLPPGGGDQRALRQRCWNPEAEEANSA